MSIHPSTCANGYYLIRVPAELERTDPLAPGFEIASKHGSVWHLMGSGSLKSVNLGEVVCVIDPMMLSVEASLYDKITKIIRDREVMLYAMEQADAKSNLNNADRGLMTGTQNCLILLRRALGDAHLPSGDEVSDAKGREAEELRSGIETLLEEFDGGSTPGQHDVESLDLQAGTDAVCDRLRTLLERVDARDSVAYIEQRGPILDNTRLTVELSPQAIEAERVAVRLQGRVSGMEEIASMLQERAGQRFAAGADLDAHSLRALAKEISDMSSKTLLAPEGIPNL